MAGDETLTMKGNLTADPELRFTPSGAAVANFNIASTPRVFDKQNNEWRDGVTNFYTCVAWRALAENIAETLRKGSGIIAEGTIFTENWDDKETGQKRSKQKVRVEDAGPSLKFATAQVTKVQRNKQGGSQGQPAQGGGDSWGGDNTQGDPWAGSNAPAQQAQPAPAEQDDPWA